ncbi:MAG: hypothetical protein JWP89_6944 [Schlesneria sp.]|nr:hypothetical protein [Schlesneria sp.]
MLRRRHFLLAAGALFVRTATAAESRIRDLRTLSVVPNTVDEIKRMYDQSRDFSAELIQEEEPLEVKTFAPFLTKLDEIEAKKKGLPNASTRRHVLSVGLEMMTDDQKQLPMLSRNQILGYLKEHFVSIQARVYRDPISRGLYLGPRCLAATRSMRSSNLTLSFTGTVAESVGNIRSFGLLLPERTPPTPSNLRTLVLVHRNQLQGAVPKTNYEYLFIRAHASGPDQLELHAFATSDERTKLHWLNPAMNPKLPSDCSVRGAVAFTEYSQQGLYPKNAVVRRTLTTGKKSFAWDSVEKHARESFGRPAMDSITQILDAIIAGEIQESKAVMTPIDRGAVSTTGN